MKSLLMTTELFRRANITTMYRASLCIAVVLKPGITKNNLAELMRTSSESIQVSLSYLARLGLTYSTRVFHKDGRSKETKVFPTPYLKDVINGIDYELNQPKNDIRHA